MPLLIELDEFHRSRVIDPDLSSEKNVSVLGKQCARIGKVV